jgi:hypothetical protein
MKRATHSIIVAAVMAVMASTSWGTIIPLQAIMNGALANAGAGTGSPGTGLMTGTFDDQTNLFSWNVTWGGLLGSPTVQHFHGPALANQNAGVQIGIGISGPPTAGSATITAPQAADLLGGLWYINLHSTSSPGGEIRGNVSVVPEPYSVAMLALGLASVAGLRRLKGQRRPPGTS